MTEMTNESKSPETFTVWMRGVPVEFKSAFATLSEAYHALANSPVSNSDFARDLLFAARNRRLTAKQIAWLHYLATESAGSAAPSIDVNPIITMLAKAHRAGKRAPKIRLKHEGSGVEIVRTSRGATGMVVDGEWRGAFPDNGLLPEIGRFQPWIPMLRALAADPASVSRQHGVATGVCCWCGRGLSTKASRYAGYGPDCADRFGLPWGDVPADFDAEGKA